MLLSNKMLFESRFSVLLPMGDIPVSCMLRFVRYQGLLVELSICLPK